MPLAGGHLLRDDTCKMTNQDIYEAILSLKAATELSSARIETRLDGHDQRFDRLEKRFDRLETRMENIETKVDRLEVRFDALQSDVTAIRRDVGAIDQRLQRVESGA